MKEAQRRVLWQCVRWVCQEGERQDVAHVCGRDRNLSVCSREQYNVRFVPSGLGAEAGW